MKLSSVEFVTSAVTIDQYPQDQLPQIVLAGRSNVGKSSFINAMLSRTKLARVSQTPGKTRLVNFFRINDQFYFVDIPGYGYAAVSKSMQDDFKEIIERYLAHSTALSFAVLLLDIRHEPSRLDEVMWTYFRAQGIPILFVLTKADKLSNNQKAKMTAQIRKLVRLQDGETMMTFSSVTKDNKDLIWEEMERRLALVTEEVQA